VNTLFQNITTASTIWRYITANFTVNYTVFRKASHWM